MTMDSMARRLGTGSAPGMPRQTGHTLVLGASSWERRQLQNILVSRARELGVDLQADDGLPVLQDLLELLH